MSKAPERIYLPVHPDDTPGTDWDDERTWCRDPINDTDQEYIRADFYEHEVRVRKTFENFSKEKAQRIEQQAAEIARLAADADRGDRAGYVRAPV